MMPASDEVLAGLRRVLPARMRSAVLAALLSTVVAAVALGGFRPAPALAAGPCSYSALGLVTCVTYQYPTGQVGAIAQYQISISWERCPAPGGGFVWVPSQTPSGMPINC